MGPRLRCHTLTDRLVDEAAPALRLVASEEVVHLCVGRIHGDRLNVMGVVDRDAELTKHNLDPKNANTAIARAYT